MPFGSFVGSIGRTFKLPELGVSEFLDGKLSPQDRANTYDMAEKYNPNVQRSLAPKPAQPTQQPTIADTGAYLGDAKPYDPNRDEARINPLRGQVRDKVRRSMELYNSLYGSYDTAARERTGELDRQFDEQDTSLDRDFEKVYGDTSQSYAARGLGGMENSDYLRSAQRENETEYQAGKQDNARRRTDAYAQIGRFREDGRAGIDRARRQLGAIDPNQLLDYSSAAATSRDLDGTIADAEDTARSLRPDGTYARSLQSVTAGKGTGLTKARARLDSIAKSSASPTVKGQIAQGILMNDPNLSEEERRQLLGYYQNLSAKTSA